MKNDLAREAGIYESVSRHLMLHGELDNVDFSLAHQFKILGQRIKHGVKEELIGLFDTLINLSRNKARIIFNSGYHESTALMEAPPAETDTATAEAALRRSLVRLRVAERSRRRRTQKHKGEREAGYR